MSMVQELRNDDNKWSKIKAVDLRVIHCSQNVADVCDVLTLWKIMNNRQAKEIVTSSVNVIVFRASS